MGDENDNQQQEEQQPQGWAVFADAFDSGGLDVEEPGEGDEAAGTGDPGAGGDGAALPAPAGEATPAVAVAPPANEPPVPAWSGQDEAGRAFKELRGEKTQAETEAAFWRAVAEGRIPNPNAAAQPTQPAQPAASQDDDPKPDPAKYTDDTAYWEDRLAWERRQAVKDVEAKFAPVQQTVRRQEINNSLGAAAAQVGDATFNHYYGLVDRYVTEVDRAMGARIAATKDPGAEVVRIGKWLAGLGGAQPTTPVTPSGPAATTPAAVPTQPAAANPLNADGTLNVAALAADPNLQQAVLRAVAAQNAAAGVIPTPSNPTLPPGPKGLGPVGGVNSPDGSLTVESIQATKDPQALRAIGAQLFAGLALS